jgi:hypothetical protein
MGSPVIKAAEPGCADLGRDGASVRTGWAWSAIECQFPCTVFSTRSEPWHPLFIPVRRLITWRYFASRTGPGRKISGQPPLAGRFEGAGLSHLRGLAKGRQLTLLTATRKLRSAKLPCSLTCCAAEDRDLACATGCCGRASRAVAFLGAETPLRIGPRPQARQLHAAERVTRRRRDETFPGLSGLRRDLRRSAVLSGWCSVRPG